MDKTDDARGGQVVHHEAIGGLERDGGEPMCADAILRLYSMTKPMTCVALMALYEQGHFQLLDPVSKFIPEFEGLKVAVEDGSDVALVDLDEPVTIRHLLTHTAGLTYGFGSTGRWRSATGRVSADQPLADLEAGENGRIAGPTNSLESSPHQVLRCGHGLVSTAMDYLRFCSMMLNGGELEGQRILGRKTVELMTTNHIAPALLPLEEGGLDKSGFGYGLGFGVLMDVGQSGTIGSNGEYYWSGAASTSFWVDPSEQFIGIQLTQFQPMSNFPNAEDFKVAAYQAIVD